MDTMKIIERLREQVKTHGAITAISNESGVHWDTVKRISRGVTPNPGHLTIARIGEAMDKLYGRQQ